MLEEKLELDDFCSFSVSDSWEKLHESFSELLFDFAWLSLALLLTSSSCFSRVRMRDWMLSLSIYLISYYMNRASLSLSINIYDYWFEKDE